MLKNGDAEKKAHFMAAGIVFLSIFLIAIGIGGIVIKFIVMKESYPDLPKASDSEAKPAALKKVELESINPTPTPALEPVFSRLNEFECEEGDERAECSLPRSFRNSIGMEFALIPAGEYLMGCDDRFVYSDKKNISTRCGAEARPAHRVVISRPFYIARTEVTQKQWRLVVDDFPERYRAKSPYHPVNMVSWNDTKDFLRALNELEPDRSYRLPSESEWEYACRAGSSKDFTFGNKERLLKDYAWYNDKSSKRTPTQPVAQKKPNAFGLYDMHGNVSEWVEDLYIDGFEDGRPTGELPRKGTGDESRKVFRGGGANNEAFYVTCSFRSNFPSDTKMRQGGFRVVLDVPQEIQ